LVMRLERPEVIWLVGEDEIRDGAELVLAQTPTAREALDRPGERPGRHRSVDE
jgi:hypothetical protein